MKNPFRFWMTGSAAVVMAAFGMGRTAAAHERHPASPKSSRFCVMETVERIEASAQEHGLSVFTRVVPDAEPYAEPDELTLIVFESSDGGTPVLMESAGAQPELPLAVAVRTDRSGATQVIIGDTDWDDLPANVARDLIELPRLVADALR